MGSMSHRTSLKILYNSQNSSNCILGASSVDNEVKYGPQSCNEPVLHGVYDQGAQQALGLEHRCLVLVSTELHADK